MEKELELNIYKINVLFSNKDCNNYIYGFLSKIQEILHLEVKYQNQENVLEKLEQVLSYFNVVFLRDLIAQIKN